MVVTKDQMTLYSTKNAAKEQQGMNLLYGYTVKKHGLAKNYDALWNLIQTSEANIFMNL